MAHPILNTTDPAYCALEGARCFCEAVQSVGFAQPINAYSASIYYLLGIIILYKTLHLPQKVSHYKKHFGWFYAFAMIFLGFGTMIFHATLKFATEVIDVTSMYAIVTGAIAINIALSLRLKEKATIGLYIVINSILLLTTIYYLDWLRIVFPIIFLLVIISEYVTQEERIDKRDKNFYLALIFALVGGVFWYLDDNRILCFENSLFQGHAVWHILLAFSGLFYYFYKIKWLPKKK